MSPVNLYKWKITNYFLTKMTEKASANRETYLKEEEFLLRGNIRRLRSIRRKVGSYLRDRYGQDIVAPIAAYREENHLYSAEDVSIATNKENKDVEDAVRYYIAPTKFARLQLNEMLESIDSNLEEEASPQEEMDRGNFDAFETYSLSAGNANIYGGRLHDALVFLKRADDPQLDYALDGYLRGAMNVDMTELESLEKGMYLIREAYIEFLEARKEDG